MTIARRLAAALCLAAALSTTACEAPLEPESRKSPSATPSPTPLERPEAEPSTAGSTSARPKPSRPTVPSITVPKLPTLRSLPAGLLGADASWPQCPKGLGLPQKQGKGAPMPLPQARYVILGLTNGPGFTANPCLADQVEWVRSRRLLLGMYAVLSGPSRLTPAGATQDGPYDAGTTQGRMGNLGYQQARYSIAVMKGLRLEVPAVWLDVEPVPDFDWGSDTAANAAVVRGAARAYREAGFEVGAYSTPALWQHVVGDLRLGVPEWRAAGQTSRTEALRRCRSDWSFQGGRALLSQWVEAERDQDVVCPGANLLAARWFHEF